MKKGMYLTVAIINLVVGIPMGFYAIIAALNEVTRLLPFLLLLPLLVSIITLFKGRGLSSEYIFKKKVNIILFILNIILIILSVIVLEIFLTTAH